MTRPARPAAELRLEPHMLPDLAAAYDRALAKLTPMLDNLSFHGRLARAWTDNPAAQEATERFNLHAVDGDRSAYAMLRLYEQELTRVRDTLRFMEAEYRRTDAESWSLS